MNRSNWKGTEALAARIFPGKSGRRTRVGGGSYALIADDVKWLFEEYEEKIKRKNTKKPTKKNPKPPKWIHEIHVRKKPLNGIPPIYIEAKKRKGSDRTTTFFRQTEKKYCCNQTDRLVLCTHIKHSPRLLVTVSDEFFAELIEAWVKTKGLVRKVNE